MSCKVPSWAISVLLLVSTAVNSSARASFGHCHHILGALPLPLTTQLDPFADTVANAQILSNEEPFPQLETGLYLFLITLDGDIGFTEKYPFTTFPVVG